MTGPDGVEPTVVPADVDAPDTVIYGLTFRQLAVLALAAVVLAAGWHLLHRQVPTLLLLAMLVALGGAAVGLALGRRDGLPLDVWVTHAVRFRRAPRTLTSAPAAPLPGWVAPPGRVVLPAPLRLPVSAVTPDGTIALGGHATTIVAASTINLGLRGSGEQAGLIDAFGRWLNGLTAPTQILVTAQPFDLGRHATTLTHHADSLPHPALAEACRQHATFLTQLADDRDPLHRLVLVTSRTPTGGPHAGGLAADTAQALTSLGATAVVLDGPTALSVLACCADPYRPTHPPGPRALPGAVITTHPEGPDR